MQNCKFPLRKKNALQILKDYKKHAKNGTNVLFEWLDYGNAFFSFLSKFSKYVLI